MLTYPTSPLYCLKKMLLPWKSKTLSVFFLCELLKLLGSQKVSEVDKLDLYLPDPTEKTAPIGNNNLACLNGLGVNSSILSAILGLLHPVVRKLESVSTSSPSRSASLCSSSTSAVSSPTSETSRTLLAGSWGQFHQRVYKKLLRANIPKAKRAAWFDCYFFAIGICMCKSCS